MIIFGIIMILSIGLFNIGEITILKCHLKNFLYSLGITFIYIPLFYKLIIYFSEENIFLK